jgi:hypothetical protein
MGTVPFSFLFASHLPSSSLVAALSGTTESLLGKAHTVMAEGGIAAAMANVD